MEDGNNQNPIVEKISKGRQKVEIKKIMDEKKLAVAFSKRRTGLFKKGSELATLCGAEVALMVVSPSGRVYKFGSPSADAVVERYLRGFHHAPPLQAFAASAARARSEAVAADLHAQMQRVEKELAAEKRRAAELRQRRKELEGKCWMAAPIHTLSKPQLMDMKARLMHMSEELTLQVSMQNACNDVTVPVPAAVGVYAGSSSTAPPPVAAQPAAQVIPPPLPAAPVLDTRMMMMSLDDDGCDNLRRGYGGGGGSGPAGFY